MHPYGMQRLIKERGKDAVVNVAQRAGLYQTIRRLEREGLIAQQQVTRDDKRPERRVYEITSAGRAITLEWMREMLSQPAQEFPQFPAALSFMALLTPHDALRQLELRVAVIDREIGRIDLDLKQAHLISRLFLLEAEYLRAMHVTEKSWVAALIAELRSGSLRWSDTWIRQIAAQLTANGVPGVRRGRDAALQYRGGDRIQKADACE